MSNGQESPLERHSGYKPERRSKTQPVACEKIPCSQVPVQVSPNCIGGNSIMSPVYMQSSQDTYSSFTRHSIISSAVPTTHFWRTTTSISINFTERLQFHDSKTSRTGSIPLCARNRAESNDPHSLPFSPPASALINNHTVAHLYFTFQSCFGDIKSNESDSQLCLKSRVSLRHSFYSFVAVTYSFPLQDPNL